MRRIMRGSSNQSRGTLSCFRPERERVRPLWASTPKRSAFTLVELLVVIGILAILAALITPAIFQARVSARNAAIKAEIDMLHMAVMNYKNEYGSFPPCFSVAGTSGPAATHAKRLFPRSTPNPDSRSPENAVVRWLRGYSSDPTDPFGAGRKKMFDFDESRVTSADEYHPSGKAGSPYVYIDAGNYRYDDDGNPVTPEILQPFTVGGNTYTADPNANPDTFQILCGGLDETFGGTGAADDLSNFWPGTRQDYLDSLE